MLQWFARRSKRQANEGERSRHPAHGGEEPGQEEHTYLCR